MRRWCALFRIYSPSFLLSFPFSFPLSFAFSLTLPFAAFALLDWHDGPL